MDEPEGFLCRSEINNPQSAIASPVCHYDGIDELRLLILVF
jgi:hypothetical protein